MANPHAIPLQIPDIDAVRLVAMITKPLPPPRVAKHFELSERVALTSSPGRRGPPSSAKRQSRRSPMLPGSRTASCEAHCAKLQPAGC